MPAVILAFDRPPSAFIFAVLVDEPDEIAFDCERVTRGDSTRSHGPARHDT